MLQVYRAVLFDMDGTLVETQIDFKELRRRLGVPERESILDWIERHEEPQRSRMHATLDAVEREAADSAALLPGARETIAWLEDRRIPFGILTRNSRASWETVRTRCGLPDLVHVFTRENGLVKPDPAALGPAADAWGIAPAEMVHVGDYLYDLQLARAADMYSILIHHDGVNPFPEHCHFIARDHVELLAHLQSLPFQPLRP